jgi:hypothetical protein
MRNDLLIHGTGTKRLGGPSCLNAVVSLARISEVLLPSRRGFPRKGRAEEYNQMRLKLVLISSLTAAIVGAGSVIAIILFVFSSLKPIATPGGLVFSTFLLPMLTTALASIFVYRHTARRRKLQAALTVLTSLVLILAFFLLASIIMSRRENIQAGAGRYSNAGWKT